MVTKRKSPPPDHSQPPLQRPPAGKRLKQPDKPITAKEATRHVMERLTAIKPVSGGLESMASLLPYDSEDEDPIWEGTKSRGVRTGWIRPYPPGQPHDDDLERETRRIDLIIRRAVGTAEEGPTSPEDFLEALYKVVMDGARLESGVEYETDDATILHCSPETMRGEGVQQPDAYQYQDAGQLAAKERKYHAAMILHEMGVGKTLQSLLVSETNRKPTDAPVLVAAPPPLLTQWIKTIEQNIPAARVCDYRHQNKEKFSAEYIYDNYDYVVVSYYKVIAEWESGVNFARDQDHRMQGLKYGHRDPTKSEKRAARAEGREPRPRKVALMTVMPKGLLHSVYWHRLICDEVHLTQRNGKLAHAMYPIRRKYTLLLTGTPQQNMYSDWFALTKLARLQPFCFRESAFKAFFIDKKRDAEWEEMEKLQRYILACIVRACSLTREVEPFFNGEPLYPKIDVQTIIEQVQPDDGTLYPHHEHMSGESEMAWQETTKHIWHRNKVDHISRRINQCRQGAVHPCALVDALPDPDDLNTNFTTKEIRAIQEKWEIKMNKGDNWKSTAIERVVKIIKDHMAQPKNERMLCFAC